MNWTVKACVLGVVLGLAVCGRGAEEAVRWIDGRGLPIEGRAFADTEAPYDRLPAEAKGRVTAGVWARSRQTSGLLFRFRTDSKKIRVRWDLPSGELDQSNMSRCGKSGFDVYRRKPCEAWKFTRAFAPTGQTNNCGVCSWRPGEEALVNFPLYNGVTAVAIGIDADAKLEPIVPTAKPIVWYGVSTTQGASASRPGMSFPSIISRRLDIPCVNLGFNGVGKMEMEVCDYLARVDACVYVIDTLGNMNLDLMKERYEKFLRELHRRRPDTPIVMAEERVYWSCGTLFMQKDIWLAAFRDRLMAEGGWILAYVATKDMFPHEIDETSVDGGHPNDFGMMQLADAYQKAVETALSRRQAN